MRHNHSTHLIMVAVLAMVLAACGGSGADSPDTTAVAGGETTVTVAPNSGGEGTTSEPGQTGVPSGAGSATLTVGDQTWTFDNALCAFGEEQIGQEGAEFNLSAIQDGLQLYASIDSFGHSVTLNDIQNFDDPSVDLEAGGPGAALAGGEEEFIEVDGKNISATATFVDGLGDPTVGIEGTLEATCP